MTKLLAFTSESWETFAKPSVVKESKFRGTFELIFKLNFLK